MHLENSCTEDWHLWPATHGTRQNKPLRLDVKGERKVLPMTKDMGSALVAMVKASDGFKSWDEAATPEFKVLGEGWDISPDISIDVESMQAFAAEVILVPRRGLGAHNCRALL